LDKAALIRKADFAGSICWFGSERLLSNHRTSNSVAPCCLLWRRGYWMPRLRGMTTLWTNVGVSPKPAAKREAAVGQLGARYAIWLREVKRALRDRGQLVGGLSRPILWVILLGIGLNPYFRGEVYGEARFVVPYTYLQFIFPAVIVLNILYTSVQSAVSVIWDPEFGFLREILVSPMSRSMVLLGKVLGGSTVAMAHGSLVLALARFADVSLAPGDVLYGMLLMFLLSFAMTCFGVIIANHIRSF